MSVETLDQNQATSTLDALVQSGWREIESGNFQKALDIAIRAKASRLRKMGIDLLRAHAFLRLGRKEEGMESLREELRAFPENVQARDLQARLQADVPGQGPRSSEEFHQLLAKVRPYTMLSDERLESLYKAALRVCQEDLPGHFVECGVAAGGSSALLSAVIKRHSKRPRYIYSFDTFEGMPPPTADDTHDGMEADQTGWGTGTCAAPAQSLMEACAMLGTTDVVVAVQGLFQDTLPLRRVQIGAIAFLHMDGDWYDSTLAILQNLYDQVVTGGFIQVDDYGHWDGCRKALHEWEAQRGYRLDLTRIDATGVWFLKGPEQIHALPSLVVQLDSRTLQDLVKRGLEELQEGRLEKALDTSRQILNSPDVPMGAHMLRAAALLRLGRETEGVHALRCEIELFPQNLDASLAWEDLHPKAPGDVLPGLPTGPKPPATGVYLNLGCGERYHPAWSNYDIHPSAPGILPLDARMVLEHGTKSVDVVYHSHMLEHLGQAEAVGFLKECFRVLRPGGLLRVVVPDLEGIARRYLLELDAALAGDPQAGLRRDWMVLELLDQVARHSSGGEMLKWWSRQPVPAEAFIVERVGSEARRSIAQLRANQGRGLPVESADPMQVGRFRLAGEVHRWMYDRYSLAQLLESCGFKDIRKVGATESAMPGFASYELDTEPDGSVRKPDSLFMEAFRPAN